MKSRSLEECLDIVGMSPEGHFLLRNGELMELIRIRSKDIDSLSEDEQEYLTLKWTKIYKLHAPDIKIVCMNYPCNTSIQQEFLTKKIQGTNNEIYKDTLNTYLDELIWLQKNDTELNFFLMLFSPTEDELETSIRRWKENLGTGKHGLLRELSVSEKIMLWHNLLNKPVLFKK